MHVSCCQEPTIQDLSDGRMICVMRTATGYIYYALSSDGGHSWDQPRPLRYSPGGPDIQQPVCPCPLYKLSDGRFILVFHNTDGTANGGPGPCGGTQLNRRPAYLVIGREINHPDHPIMFSKPKFLADNRGIVDGLDKTEICTYTSLFEFQGEDKDGKILGTHRPTGVRPGFWDKARYFGLEDKLAGALEISGA